MICGGLVMHVVNQLAKHVVYLSDNSYEFRMRFSQGAEFYLDYLLKKRSTFRRLSGHGKAESIKPMRVWFRAMHLLAQGKKGLSNIELGRRLGISTNAAWRVQHKLMQAMIDRDR